MDEGTIKTQNPTCRLYWCLIEFIDWRYSQSCWYFWSLLWACAVPSAFSLTSPTPPPLPKVNVQYIKTDSVWLWGGMLSCVVDHILQKFNTLFLTRFRTYKIATPPPTKTPVKTTFRDWCLYSSFVHAYQIRADLSWCDGTFKPRDRWVPERKVSDVPSLDNASPPRYGPESGYMWHGTWA